MDINELISRDGSPYVLNPILGPVVQWIGTQVEGLSEEEFFEWLTLLYIKGLTEKQKDSITQRHIQYPRLMPADFLLKLDVTLDFIWHEQKPIILKYKILEKHGLE